jgi:hypothetical protein
MPFLPALTLLFVFAKLAEWITWSWWIVFSPVIIPGIIGLIIIVIWFIVQLSK